MMEYVLQPDMAEKLPAKTTELWHETGVRSAFAIVQSLRMASITSPHSAEFLPHKNHPMFLKMAGFKGGGTLLKFAWTGPCIDVREDFAYDSGPDVLVDVYQKAEIIGSDPIGRAGGLSWRGHKGTYWCSRIYKTAGSSLRLVGADVRPFGKGPNREQNVHHEPCTPRILTQLVEKIGEGLNITVDGEPLRVSDIRSLPVPAPTRGWFARLLTGTLK